MSVFPADLLEQSAAVLELCRTRALTLTTAESCTGGLIAACFTEVAGASDVFERGYVTYSNRAKEELLSVGRETLARFGAVSAETALEMAIGAREKTGSDIAIAVTGIAGPGGGTEAKPVGLVYVAVCFSTFAPLRRENRFGSLGRSEIRMLTLRQALRLTQEVLRQSA